jgi:hypothetical protein
MLQRRGLLITEYVVVLYTEERPILELRSCFGPVGRMDDWLRMMLEGLMEVVKRASNTRTGRRRRPPGFMRFLKVKPCELTRVGAHSKFPICCDRRELHWHQHS